MSSFEFDTHFGRREEGGGQKHITLAIVAFWRTRPWNFSAPFSREEKCEDVMKKESGRSERFIYHLSRARCASHVAHRNLGRSFEAHRIYQRSWYNFVGWKTCDRILWVFGNHVAAIFGKFSTSLPRTCRTWSLVFCFGRERAARTSDTLIAFFSEEKKVCVWWRSRRRRGVIYTSPRPLRPSFTFTSLFTSDTTRHVVSYFTFRKPHQMCLI
jgi:hypothetical protein